MIIKPFRNVEPKIHPEAFVAENATIIGDVEIGAKSSIWYNVVLRGDVNFIRIGTKTNVQDGTVVHVTSNDYPTIIEDEVTIGHSATIHGCHIKRGSLIGIGAIILDGASIGENSLVAAGSLVTPNTEIPPRSLVLGSPARIKRQLSEDEVLNLKRFWENYVRLIEEYKSIKESALKLS